MQVCRLDANLGSIDLDLLALRRVRLIGVTFRTRSKEERIDCVQRCAADLLEAHDCMERDEHAGKLVLEIS